MGFQVPITIADAIRRIRERRLLLPAIQREFVWKHTKVEWLFDSLLQEYPIGSFLFWEVDDPQSKADYRYYEFLREYRELFCTENPEFNTAGHQDFDAVLDGQQRLTGLYIGLCGTYAYYRGRVRREDTEYAIPTRRLYLNVIERAPEREEQPGSLYEFKFLTDAEYAEQKSKWFRVSRILEFAEFRQFSRMMLTEAYQANEFAMEALSQLQAVVHSRQIINYYRVEDADLEEALNVFVRVNSAEPLTLSDMLMSTAIANWQEKDARKEIPGLVQQIRDKGFFIDKDFVLKACLYLYSSDIRYRVSNFTATRVKPFEDNWEAIQTSIVAVFDLVRAFGYTDTSLTSKNTLLPIVFWVHHRGLAESITSSVALRPEREAICAWLHTMLLKGVIGAGSADTVLAAIRRAFTGEDFAAPYVQPDLQQFPVGEIAHILRGQGKDPQITDEFINALLMTQKDAKQAFTILALLAPHLDYRNRFHADHLHPAAAFGRRRLAASGVPESDWAFFGDANNWNSILNLAHLDAHENMSKQDTSLADWVIGEAERQQISQAKFCSDRLLPEPTQLAFSDFRAFIARRRELLGERLRALLQSPT